jgi:type II secretory pathway predicted ATPase ExeA
MPGIKPNSNPIQLGRVLVEHGISQSELAARIVQPSGKPLHRVAINQLCNHDMWPITTPRAAIVAATEALLREYDVAEAVIATVWDLESAPTHHAMPQYRRRLKPVFTPFDDDSEVNEMLTPAAKSHFKLFRDPFHDDIQSFEDVYLAADQRYVREAMFTTAKHGGFVAVVGESGAGKSVLRRDLIERIQRESAPILTIQPKIIDKTRLTSGMIFEAIIDDLRPGESVRRSQEAKARQAEKMLRESSRAGNTHVLIIEEAHDLTIGTLKILKRFWELEDGFRRLLAIILIGQPELKVKFHAHNYEAREVINRCEVAELLPLDTHLEAYLTLKFKRVGAELANVFEPNAFDALRGRLVRQVGQRQVVSELYPLRVNNVVTRLMNLAAEIGAERVGADLVKEI